MEYKLCQQKIPNFSKIYFPFIGSPDNGSNRFFPVGCLKVPDINNGDLLQISGFMGLNAESFTKSYLNSTSFLCLHNQEVLTESPKIVGKSVGAVCAENMAGRVLNSGVVYRIKLNNTNIIVDSSIPKPLYIIHYMIVRSTKADVNDFVKYAGLRDDGSVSDAYYLLEALHSKVN